MECDQKAEWLCFECTYENGEPGYVCNEHRKDHHHEAYGEPVEIFNSPRLGLCGYEGPAKPPY